MANETRKITIESILGGHSPTTHFAGADQFRASLGIDPALPANDNNSPTKGIIASGLLRPSAYSQIVSGASSSMGSTAMWLVQNPKDQYTYVYDISGSVYTLDSNLSNFAALSDAGEMTNATGNGAAYYDNYVYFAKNTTIARYGPLDGTPKFNGDYWITTLSKTALTNPSNYPSDGSSIGLAANLERYYPLDGNSNESTHGLNGVDSNITYSAANGKIVQGAGFNGTTSGIRESTPITIPNNATIACWIKTTQTPSGANPMIFGFRTTGNTFPQFMFNLQNLNGRATLSVVDSNGVSIQLEVDSVVSNDGNWHHIVAVKSGNDFKLYADGVEDASGSVTFTGNFSNVQMAIGHYFDNSEYYSGAVDECGYWSRALTAAEVVSLYNAGAGLAYPFPNSSSGTLIKYPNHVMHRHSDGKLYFADVVGNQGVLHVISTSKTSVEGDTDSGSTYTKLQFGYGLYITAIESYGEQLVIALYEGTSSGSRGPIAKLAFWDTTSQNFNSIIWVEFADNFISALKNINGVLYVASGNAGQSGFRVSRFVGGYTMEEVDYTELGTTPFPGAIDGNANRLLFGSYTQVPESAACVFSLGLQKSALGQALFNIASLGGNLVTSLILAQRPTSVIPEGFSFYTPLVGFNTSISQGDLGIFNTANYATKAQIWWSQTYRVGQSFKITKIRIPLATPLSANTIITPTIYIDEAESSRMLAAINSTNYAVGKRNIVIRPENLTGEHNFWIELKWTGSDLAVVGLPIVVEYELIDD